MMISPIIITPLIASLITLTLHLFVRDPRFYSNHSIQFAKRSNLFQNPTDKSSKTNTMANLHKEDLFHLHKEEEDKEFDLGSEEPESAFPLRVLCMLGDITVGQAHRFSNWLKVVRKRRRRRSSGFPHRSNRFDDIPLSAEESSINLENTPALGHTAEVSLFQRFGNAAMLDIESSSFSWNMLSSLHHTEYGSSMEQTEEEMNKALEVTVNSGGVVFFALFNQPGYDESTPREAAAVIKFSSTRMATQSERLGYEFAKRLGVRIPQVRIIHNSSSEWHQIREAAERIKNVAISEGDEVGEMTCSELLEALELSRCLLLMNYVHGSPLLESTYAFDSQEAAGRTAYALGRVLMLDLVIRNEDRLPCRRLRWRGNPANLMLADKVETVNVDSLQVAFDTAIKNYRPGVILPPQKERRSTSVDGKLRSQSSHGSGLLPQGSDLSDIVESPNNGSIKTQASVDTTSSDFHIVAIDSLVPRKPPAGKRANDQENYPKLVELLINSFEYASHVLHEITGAKLGYPAEDSDRTPEDKLYEMTSVVKNFRSGFRAALRDLQGFHIFLLTLHQKLEGLLRLFDNIMINKTSCLDSDREDLVVPESLSQSDILSIHNHSPPSKERGGYDSNVDFNGSELHKAVTKSSSFTSKDLSDSGSPVSRDSFSGKSCKGSTEQQRSMRLTSKLRDFHKYAKGDLELSKELERWNEMLRSDAIKLCRDNNFTTGFFEGSDSNFVVDAYELKVRLEHILDRVSLISHAGNTEKPALVAGCLFIGGALAARSVYTLQQLGIAHILCLCSNEIGQSDSQFPELFEYRNFSICDDEDASIGELFEETHDFINHIENIGGKVLVHCFEGKSRSATVVLAYLMLRKSFTLLEAWNTLKRVHRRAQPNDGFAKILLDLDKQLHGKVSMEWKRRRPMMRVCPICGKDAGISSSSLKLHVQKSHKKLSSGSVDSAMSMEIQKALDALKLSRSSSVSPKQRQSSSMDK